MKTIKDLQKIKETKLKSMGGRLGNEDEKMYIMTCCGTGCFGLCAEGPIVVIHPENIDDYIAYDGRENIEKLAVYQENGLIIGKNLIITQDDAHGNCQSQTVYDIIERFILPHFEGIVLPGRLQ